MINESLITQKISELILEAQTGIKRPKTIKAPKEANDNFYQEVFIISDAEKENQAKVYSEFKALKKALGMNFSISEEVAERIARNILKIKYQK
jgi:formyltetrahydrofolate hydrolase